MTQLRGIHSIDHFALFVPSLAEADYFYNSFGLSIAKNEAGLSLAAADGHTWAHILPAEQKSLAWL